jgi:hypothetical protein
MNPYHVLQIRRDATPAEIRDAYRRLALWHHPGRGKCLGLATDELQRRFCIFDMVAACYETLMDREARQACDALLKRLEVTKLAQHLPLAGELHVGGKRFWTGPAIQLQQQQHMIKAQHDDQEGIPALSRASSHSSTDEHADHYLDVPDSQCRVSFLDKLLPGCGGGGGSGDRKESTRITSQDFDDDDDDVPSISTSSTTTMDVIHYSESETNRLFGGSYSLLHQARQWKPFTDPHIVFEQVFGAHMFPMMQRYPPLSNALHSSIPPPMTPSSPTRYGSSRTLADGTRITTSSRIVHDRQLTRVEKLVTTLQGQRQLVICVSSEEHCGMANNHDKNNSSASTRSHDKLGQEGDPQRPLLVAISSSDEEPSSLFCLTQEWLTLCPFGS